MFPRTQRAILEQYIDPINLVAEKYEINTRERMAMFLAQCGHESAGFSVITENLNYRADRLMVVFPKYFRNVDVNAYARNPEKIANRVYANRMGNGPESSGDGWRFRGSGIVQLTGRSNYTEFANYMNMELDEAVEYIRTAEGATESAGWFWHINNLNQPADNQDILTVTRRINGGTHGLEDRTRLFDLAMNLMD